MHIIWLIFKIFPLHLHLDNRFTTVYLWEERPLSNAFQSMQLIASPTGKGFFGGAFYGARGKARENRGRLGIGMFHSHLCPALTSPFLLFYAFVLFYLLLLLKKEHDGDISSTSISPSTSCCCISCCACCCCCGFSCDFCTCSCYL